MKNIVVCIDGTDNQFSGDQTNVIRTYKVCEGPPGQACYYDPGVGTLPLHGGRTWLGDRASIIAGLAFGAGLMDDIEEAYRYLMRVYNTGDQIYLFGFSRGAFTVRALAGMIHTMGLLYPDSDQLVPYARKYWRQYRRKGGKEMAVCDDFKRTLAREVPIHFIGVWDTVSSVGMQNIILHVSDFPFCFSNPSVKTVRHAVSIDERRAFFRQNLMGHYPNQDVKNVWFAGVHSDVGGGYPPPECGLSKEAFQWMMAEAQLSGLKIKTAPLSGAYADALTQGSPPDPLGPIHHSLTWKWAAAEVIPTRHISMTDHNQYHWAMNLGRPRNVLASKDIPGVAVHESVLDRIDRLGAYRPPNLPNSSAGLRAIYRIEPRIHVK